MDDFSYIFLFFQFYNFLRPQRILFFHYFALISLLNILSLNLIISSSPHRIIFSSPSFFHLFLGEYKRLVSSLITQTTIIEKENKDDESLQSDAVSVKEALDEAEARNEQIKRLLELQNYATQVGDVPGEFDGLGPTL